MVCRHVELHWNHYKNDNHPPQALVRSKSQECRYSRLVSQMTIEEIKHVLLMIVLLNNAETA